MLWPASDSLPAVLLAMLLAVPRQRAGRHIAAVAVASLATNADPGKRDMRFDRFTGANMAEPASAA